MRVYGNLMNRVHESIQSAAPKIGDGATIFFYSDRHVATVIAVSANGKRVEVQYDTAIRTDSNGMSESQDYRYERNPFGTIEIYTLRKNGQYIHDGDPMRSGRVIRFGERDEYHDFSF